MSEPSTPEWDEQIGNLIEVSQGFNNALGAFILIFSRVEGSVYKVMLRYAGIGDAIGREFFSGMRADQMIDHIYSLLTITAVGRTEAEHLRKVLGHFNSILTTRNAVVHNALPNFSMRGVAVDTSPRIKRPEKAKSYRLSPDDLQAMTADLTDIELHLSLHLLPEFSPPPADWPTTWRYKPPQPSNTERKTPTKSQGR